VGTASLARILRAVEAGTARAKDLADLREAAGFMSTHGYCAHTRTAAGALSELLTRFRPDVDAHLAAGACPRAEHRSRPFDAGSPERQAIERLADNVVAARGA
jgi:hypothetical protein